MYITNYDYDKLKGLDEKIRSLEEKNKEKDNKILYL